jgi:3-deoxy-manno-octulosonate cytidylyltransferase (CMP-KDO synthetase)
MKTVTGHHFTGIIPARYASTRFPGKPLAIIGNKPMIQLVYERVSTTLENVYVATDDIRIADAVNRFGGKVIMTSPAHKSGTDRCAEAIGKIENETGGLIDIIINIQGDEPFIRPEQIELLLSCFDDENVEIATLIRKVDKNEELNNVNHPKVVISTKGDAIYFSRSVIPFYQSEDEKLWQLKHTYYKHIGIYGYKRDTLLKITALEQGSLELAEGLEQNRWIENGIRIRTAVTPWESIAIDTPPDLEVANKLIRKSR